jgi:PhnB protein
MQIQPYLFFDGRCEEALEYYKRVLGAKVEALMRFKDSPDPNSCAPADREKVMHANFRVGDTQVMASDGRCGGHPKFEGFALSVTSSDPAKAERLFAGLAEGGQVQMPMTKTFFAERFGMVADKFGVSWMILAAPKK